MTGTNPRSIPTCLPGQILLRDDDGNWTCVWPTRHFTPNEKWFLCGVFMTSMTFIAIAIALVVLQ